ncbi:MAG: epoxyqueuosine reductase QueH [Candidatus Cloacimonetes bacterium]|nr:epoxyqueuosine reductase QueH [Candidatus Cloacimonadota bacterium]
MFAEDHIFLHTCCAPCLIAPYYSLRECGRDITAFWYNPNIHPYTEYKLRLDTLKNFAAEENFRLICHDDYALEEFVTNAVSRLDERCGYCYDTRLKAAAITAKENGYRIFSTTLLYSKFQNHDLICSMAEKYAKAYGLNFYYEDFRLLWKKGIELSKARGMYRQKYCGCIFSEKERYLGK